MTLIATECVCLLICGQIDEEFLASYQAGYGVGEPDSDAATVTQPTSAKDTTAAALTRDEESLNEVQHFNLFFLYVYKQPGCPSKILSYSFCFSQGKAVRQNLRWKA